MDKFFILLIAGGLGTYSRFVIVTWVTQLAGTEFPFGTLAVNLIGCLIIGFIAGLPNGANMIPPYVRLFIMTGIIGGFTTFSSYQYESFLLVKDGLFLRSLTNLAGSMILGFLIVAIGYVIARLTFSLLRGGVS